MVHVVTDDHSLAARPPIAWALEHHLADRDEAIALVSEPGAPAESYRVTAGDLLTVSAADDRGFVYGIQEIAERLRDGGIADEVTITGRPAVPIRGLVRSFSSVHEDTPWFVDREFWTEYLDFLADCRFSRFHLALGMQYNYGADRNGATDNYLCFAYPFLFDVDGWEVRAEGVHAAEQARNLAALQYIAAETKRRGMDFQLGLWNHAYDYGRDSRHWYPITGLTPETHAAYSAAGLSRLLREVPEVDGLSFRVHYEGGIHENAHEVFWDAMFQAASEAGRPLQIDMHAKGVDQALLDAADKPNISPILSGKYWAEHLGLPYHQARIRHREAARPIPPGHEMKGITEFSRRFTRYGYGDFLREDRVVDLMFRIWPGTQKLLLWGDPAIAAGYGRYATFGGSAGVDYCEPLFFKGRKGSGIVGGREPYLREDLRLGGREWRKHRHSYTLMGRHLYDPAVRAEAWRAPLRAQYGDAAELVEAALTPASRILPLVVVVHGVNGSNNGYAPDMYVDLPISAGLGSEHYASDTDAPTNWGAVSPFDPEMFVIIDRFVEDALAGRPTAAYTPLEVADRIDALCDQAEAPLAGLGAFRSSADVERASVDIAILIRLGRFYAEKLRAATSYAVWRQASSTLALDEAIAHARRAHAAYAGILPLVDGVYRDELAFGVERSEHGHWRDRIPDMEADLAELEAERAAATASDAASGADALDLTRGPRRDGWALEHDAPASFSRGAAVPIAVRSTGVDAARLHYRHVDQSESWQVVELERDGDVFAGEIPAEYTAGTYPLMYYVTVSTEAGEDLYPGLSDDLSTQPYFALASEQSERGAGWVTPNRR
ncbi:hypothetical protein GCM10009840_22920 [Pseudolysinimonas kribbensis]|uniref:hypothetical protein n=1 Tax=Pseudolysinimonas kribbensis TaxID=433641 RepID=UPI0031D5C121